VTPFTCPENIVTTTKIDAVPSDWGEIKILYQYIIKFLRMPNGLEQSLIKFFVPRDFD